MLLLPRSGLLTSDMGSLVKAALGADCAVFDLAISALTGAESSCMGELYRITQCSTAAGAYARGQAVHAAQLTPMQARHACCIQVLCCLGLHAAQPT